MKAETKPTLLPVLKRGLIAILRGIKPQEAEGVADILAQAGFEVMEVPLNSPDPLRSIELMSRKYAGKILVGAGTVLKASEVDEVANAGGRLIISPNVKRKVVERSAALGLVSMPGVLTPTEAHQALQYGASALKFFPASVLGPAGIQAIKAILPANTPIGAVGGVSEQSFRDYWRVGVRVFGIGSNLYKPGDSLSAIQKKAEMIVRAYDEAVSG